MERAQPKAESLVRWSAKKALLRIDCGPAQATNQTLETEGGEGRISDPQLVPNLLDLW